MQIGSAEHKAPYIKDLIKDYYKNLWQDELYLELLRDNLGDKRKEIAEIDLKLEKKEYPSKNAGEKAKFVAQEGLKAIETKIAKVEEKIAHYWPRRIASVTEYAKSQGIAV